MFKQNWIFNAKSLGRNFEPIELFSEDFLKTLLKGREIFRKKYRAVFEKSPKNMVFLTSKKRPLLEGVFEPKFSKFQT